MFELRGIVKGMDCANCVTKVRKQIETKEGIEDVKLNLVSTKLIVAYNKELISEKEIIRIIKKAGYEFDHSYDQKSFFNLKYNKNLIFFLVGAVFLLTALLIDALGFIQFHPYFYIPIYVIGGIPVYRKALASLRAKTLDIDILMVIAVIGAIAIEHWEEAAEIIVLFTLAELLEAFSMDKARQSIRSLMDLTPPTATRLLKGKKHEIVPLEDLVVGDRVSVKPGGKIPIDGKIDWGNSNVDQSPITGESTPIIKAVGDEVFSGSINLDGYIIIRVTRMPEESTIARIRQLIEEAEQQKSNRELFIQKFAKYYTPIMVSIALLIFLIPGVFLNIPINQEILQDSLYQSLVILVISCPCALVLATPITVVTAITRASKRGVLIKGGKFLEAISDVDTVAMDKTGTLSTGKIKVYKVETFEGYSEKEIVEIAYGLEYHSEHKIAQAIIELGERNKSRLFGYKDVTIIPGKGIKGTRKGTTYYLGNETLIEEVLPSEACDLDCEESESIVSYVLTDEKIIAHIHMSDELRPETKTSIDALRDIGVKNIVMLTGDNEAVASKIAYELGIDYKAELLPEQKMQYIKQMKDDNHSIAMIGDGINDSPALALSDVGIAMGTAGTAIAIETSDIVLSSDDLFSLPYLFRLSKETKRTIKINIFLSLFIKFTFFVLVILSVAIESLGNFFGESLLWLAVLIGDLGASLLVIINAMTVGRKKYTREDILPKN
ncbi:MAG: cation-translocating P-type ATPase [Candidatus Heimdallarchaeota archaeon]|nr:cation-translocating P-type ATPase [Candidatus Heimdallarchaeota archaeon]